MRPGFARTLVLAVTMAMLAGLTRPPAAQAQQDEGEGLVTLNLRDTPLRNAIDLIFQGSGLQYAVAPNVPNVPVTVNVRDLSLQSALRLVLRLGAVSVPGLTHGRDGDVYVIRIRRQPTRGPQPLDAEGETPPELAVELDQLKWERIPIQFNNVAIFALAFGGAILPTEDQILSAGTRGGFGGGGFGGGGIGGFGRGTGGFGNMLGVGNQRGFGSQTGGIGAGGQRRGNGFGNLGNSPLAR